MSETFSKEWNHMTWRERANSYGECNMICPICGEKTIHVYEMVLSINDGEYYKYRCATCGCQFTESRPYKYGDNYDG